MLIYSILIILIFVIQIFFSERKLIITHRGNISMYISWFLLLSLVAGLRGDSVGTDTESYKSIFLIINNLDSGNAGQEFLFQYLNLFIGLFTSNTQWIILVCSAITMFGVLVFIKNNSSHVTLSVFLFVALYYYFSSMNGVRQYLAISLVLIAIEYAKNRKFLSFALFIILAIGFHMSAILGVIFWWICSNTLKMKKMVIIAVLMLVVMYGYSYLIHLIPGIQDYFPRYYGYLSNTTEFSRLKMVPIVNMMIFLGAIIVVFSDKNWRSNPRNMMLFYSSEIAAILSMGTFIIPTLDSNLLNRTGWLFQVFSIALIPNMLDSSLIKKIKPLPYFVFILLGLLHMYYLLSKGAHRVVPYELGSFRINR